MRAFPVGPISTLPLKSPWMIATFAGHGSRTTPVNHRKQRTSDDERKSLLRVFISTRFVLPPRYPRFAPEPLYIHSAELSAGCFNWIHSVVIPGVRESRSSPEPYSDYCNCDVLPLSTSLFAQWMVYIAILRASILVATPILFVVRWIPYDCLGFH